MLERIIFIVSGSRLDPNSVTTRDFVMSGKEIKLYFPTVQLGYLITVIMQVKFEQSLCHCFLIQLNNSKVF